MLKAKLWKLNIFGALFVASDESVKVFTVLCVLWFGDKAVSAWVKSAQPPQNNTNVISSIIRNTKNQRLTSYCKAIDFSRPLADLFSVYY